MKCQDFSSDENLLPSEDTIFILHLCRYRDCRGHVSLSQQEKSITASRQRSLYNKQNITCPHVDTDFIFSCSTRYLTAISSWTLEDEIRIHVRACNIVISSVYKLGSP